MKTFDDSLEHIEVKLKDKDGNEEIKKAKYLTIYDLKEMDKLLEGKDEGNFDIICKRMAYIFGGKPEDYGKYSFPLLRSVIDYIKEVYIINPLDQKNQVKK